MQPRHLSATTLIGDKVHNRQGETLGEVKDFMMDLQNSKVEYAVMKSGGFLGMGGKLFAIPITAFDVDTDKHQLVLGADKEQFEQAEGFDEDNWPNTADPSWGERTYRAFGQEAYWRG